MDCTDSIDSNITIWESLFDEYNIIVNKCTNYIKNISEIKNNLTNLLGNQKKDDINFYKSIIDNSYFHLNNSLKIRQSKFLIDLNNILSQINDCTQIDSITKGNFTTIMKNYQKMAEKIKYDRDNNTLLTWVKNDKIESLNELNNNMNEIMNYHLKLINHINSFIEMEQQFYCGDTMNKDNMNKEMMYSDNTTIMELKGSSYMKNIINSSKINVNQKEGRSTFHLERYNKSFKN